MFGVTGVAEGENVVPEHLLFCRVTQAMVISKSDCERSSAVNREKDTFKWNWFYSSGEFCGNSVVSFGIVS